MARKTEGSGASFVMPQTTLRDDVKGAWAALVTVIRGIMQPRFLVTMTVLLLLVSTAMAVVYTTHWNRRLYADLRALQSQHGEFEREWSQLLLEQGAWSAHARVERIASDDMGMVVAGPQDFRVVQ